MIISYFFVWESFISSINNLFDIDIDDSPSDKNELPIEEPPNEFFLSWIELIDLLISSSNSDFFWGLKLIGSKVDLCPSILLYFTIWDFLVKLFVMAYSFEK